MCLKPMTLFEREGQFHLSGVFWKPAQASETNVSNYSGDREWYEGNLSPSYFQVDVRLHHRELTHAPAYWQEIYARQLQTAEKNLAESPGDLTAEYRRAQAYLGLGQDEKGLAQFNALINKDGPEFLQFFGPRAVLLARAGKVKAAREDLNVVLAQLPIDTVLINAVRGAEAAAYLEEEAGFLKKLDGALQRRPGNGTRLLQRSLCIRPGVGRGCQGQRGARPTIKSVCGPHRDLVVPGHRWWLRQHRVDEG